MVWLETDQVCRIALACLFVCLFVCFIFLIVHCSGHRRANEVDGVSDQTGRTAKEVVHGSVSQWYYLPGNVITPSSLCSVSKPFLFLRPARRRSQHSHARGVMPLTTSTTGSQTYMTVEHFVFLNPHWKLILTCLEDVFLLWLAGLVSRYVCSTN